MEITYTHAAGLDSHKQTVGACAFTSDATGKPRKQTRTFGTMPQVILALVDWLLSLGARMSPWSAKDAHLAAV